MGVIRLLLAISVIIAHSSPILGVGLVGGAAAVQIFYMISGFYMALVLNEKYVGERASYGVFIGNRLLRLIPVYATVLLATIGAQLLFPGAFGVPHNTVALWGEHGPGMQSHTVLLLGLSNLLMLGQDAITFMGYDVQSGSLYPSAAFSNEPMPAHLFLFIPQAWSLGVELLFYFIAPFVLRRRISVLLGLVILSIGVRVFLFARYGLINDPWNYRFFPCELAFFLIGSIGYRFYAVLRDRESEIRLVSTIAFWSLVLAIVLYSFLPMPGKRIAVCAFAACAIPLVFARTRKSRIDRYLGEMSYPMYISHVLFAAVLKSYGVNWGIVLVPVTMVASVGLYELVDRRVESYRHRLYTSRKAIAGSEKVSPASGVAE